MAKQPLYFVTGNKNKFKEVKTTIPEIKHLDIDVPEIQSNDPHEVIKAKLASARERHTGRFIVDDTSVAIEALNGFPGPFAKWMLDSLGTKGIYDLATKLGNSKVTIRTIIGYSDSDDNIEFFEGTVEANIVVPASDGHGFGYDEILQPVGESKTFAQMTLEEKLDLSHRNKAIKKLRRFLAE